MAAKLNKKSIEAPDVLNTPQTYGKAFSRGLRVSLGGYSFLFISGTASIDARGHSCHIGDFSAQTRRTFHNITALLASEGAGWQHVCQTRCYLKSMADYDCFNKVRNDFYKQQNVSPFPASVCVEATLCRPELLVEIEAIAVLPALKKRRHPVK